MILSDTTTPGQSRPGSNGNKGVLRLPQSSSSTGASQSGSLVSYPEHLLGRVGLTPLQRCSWCILQAQPTGLLFRVTLLLIQSLEHDDCILCKEVRTLTTTTTTEKCNVIEQIIENRT